MDHSFSIPFNGSSIHFCGSTQGLTLLRDAADGPPSVLFASEGALRRADLESFAQSLLRSDGIWLNRVPPNPDIQAVTDALIQLHGKPFSKFIAVGGGSAIDLAKAVSALSSVLEHPSCETVRQAITEKTYLNGRAVPICAVPTTAGTGSEVTQWATVWDLQKKEKYSVDMPDLLPRQAIIVPEWTLTLSEDQTASTGLDALSHAMESFWANARNPISQALALSSVSKVARSLPEVMQHPQSISLRSEMCLASLLAGLAFSQTRTTACHSISYPLTLYFSVPHGFAAAATLAEVMERNQAHVPEIHDLNQIFAPYGGFRRWMDSLSSQRQLLRLSRFGIGVQDIPLIADAAFTAGRMDNNPAMFTRDDVASILANCI